MARQQGGANDRSRRANASDPNPLNLVERELVAGALVASWFGATPGHPIALAFSLIPPASKYAVIPVAGSMWQHVESSTQRRRGHAKPGPAGLGREAPNRASGQALVEHAVAERMLFPQVVFRPTCQEATTTHPLARPCLPGAAGTPGIEVPRVRGPLSATSAQMASAIQLPRKAAWVSE